MPSFDSSNDLRLNLLFKNLLNRRFTKVAAADRQELAGITYTAPEQIFAEPIPTTDPGSHPTPPRDFQDNDPNNSSLGKILVSDLCGDYSYIKKYENIHMSVISDTNNLTWRATNVSMQPLLKQAIIGSNWFRISVEVDSNIAISNNSAPLIHNGLLIFTGNSDLPNSNSTVKISQILIYEGLTLAESLNDKHTSLTPIEGELEAIKARLDSIEQVCDWGSGLTSILTNIRVRLVLIDGLGILYPGLPHYGSPYISGSAGTRTAQSIHWVAENVRDSPITPFSMTASNVTAKLWVKVPYTYLGPRQGMSHTIDNWGYEGYFKNNEVQIYGYNSNNLTYGGSSNRHTITATKYDFMTSTLSHRREQYEEWSED